MPIITVKLAKGRSLQTKRKLVQALTETAVSLLDVKSEWVTVLIEEYDRENWASNGKLHSEKFGKGFGKKGAK
jgi:4-oxalocrotonate tautomerase